MGAVEVQPRPLYGNDQMEMFSLVPHPDFSGNAVESVRVQLAIVPGQERTIWAEYEVRLRDKIVLPDALEPNRADDLWRTTCFEMFIAQADRPRYIELNLSPSFEWAAYEFSGYRDGMKDLAVPFDPEIEISAPATYFFLAADIGLANIDFTDARLGLAAVIEETDGTKSYWALAHAPGPPDFHNRDCFIASLPTLDPA